MVAFGDLSEGVGLRFVGTALVLSSRWEIRSVSVVPIYFLRAGTTHVTEQV